MTRVPGRFPARISIFDVPADIKTIIASIESLNSAPTAFIIPKSDQLNDCTVTIRKMFQPNMTQAGESAVSETSTGLEATVAFSIAKDIFPLFSAAFNGTIIPAATNPNTNPGLMRISDQSGLTVGACDELKYKTCVIQPYGCGDSILTNPETWLIFPWSLMKGDATLTFAIGQQYGYNINLTAFPNPATGKDRVLRGNTALLPTSEYPNVVV